MKIFICIGAIVCIAAVLGSIPLENQTDGRSRLTKDILVNYTKIIPADSINSPLLVGFNLTLVDFQVFVEKRTLEFQAWMRQEWDDPRLKWNPDEYGGVTKITLESDLIWKPDIILDNSADILKLTNCWHPNVVIQANGRIEWVPTCKLEAGCDFKIDSNQNTVCVLKFVSWAYTESMFNFERCANVNDDWGSRKDILDLSKLTSSSTFEIIKAEDNCHYPSNCYDPDICIVELQYKLTLKRKNSDESLVSRLTKILGL